MKKHFISFFVATSPFFLWGTYFEAYGLKFPGKCEESDWTCLIAFVIIVVVGRLLYWYWDE